MDVGAIVSQLLPTIVNVIGGTLQSSGSGFFGKLREAGALAGVLSNAGEQFKGNALMEGLLGSLTGEEGTNLLKNLDLGNLDLGNVMNQVGGLDDTLKDAGEDGAPVKQFIFDVANQVANAAGGGLFGSGDKISEGEASFLSDLKGKLGL
jgi:hypothetical protein